MGIVAKSDGQKLSIIALNGEDLNIEISGDLGSGFSVGNGQEIILEETGESPFVPLSPYSGYDFSEHGLILIVLMCQGRAVLIFN